jgi:hypothetical protein
VALGALIALPLGALIAFLVSRWLRRARPLPPPPPPRPAWELALEALALVRGRRLIEQGLTTQHFAEVSLAVRELPGAPLRLRWPGVHHARDSGAARAGPARAGAGRRDRAAVAARGSGEVREPHAEAAECELALERAEHIVRRTMLAIPRRRCQAPLRGRRQLPRAAAASSGGAPPAPVGGVP